MKLEHFRKLGAALFMHVVKEASVKHDYDKFECIYRTYCKGMRIFSVRQLKILGHAQVSLDKSIK